jgi:hypothetical protein
MHRVLLLLAAVLAATAARADVYKGCFEVVGIPEGDSLKVFARASARSRGVGFVKSGTGGVTIEQCVRTWCYIQYKKVVRLTVKWEKGWVTEKNLVRVADECDIE